MNLSAAKLAVAGDSAGGNLATAVAMLARDRGGPVLAMQVLAYPVTTTDLTIGFDNDYEGFSLYRDELQWHQDNYLPDPARATDPLVSPLDHGDLANLPPALILTAQCDPLHAQGELYAEALKRAGVPVEHRQWPGMIHGFFQLPTVFGEGAEAVQVAGQALQRSLDYSETLVDELQLIRGPDRDHHRRQPRNRARHRQGVLARRRQRGADGSGP